MKDVKAIGEDFSHPKEDPALQNMKSHNFFYFSILLVFFFRGLQDPDPDPAD
jgi:hypothetical protein